MRCYCSLITIGRMAVRTGEHLCQKIGVRIPLCRPVCFSLATKVNDISIRTMTRFFAGHSGSRKCMLLLKHIICLFFSRIDGIVDILTSIRNQFFSLRTYFVRDGAIVIVYFITNFQQSYEIMKMTPLHLRTHHYAQHTHERKKH